MRRLSNFLVAVIIVRCAATHPQEFVHPQDPRAALEPRFATPSELVERASINTPRQPNPPRRAEPIMSDSASSAGSYSSSSTDSGTGFRRRRYPPIKAVNRGETSEESVMLTTRDGYLHLFLWSPDSVTGAVLDKWGPSFDDGFGTIVAKAARRARDHGRVTHVALVCEMGEPWKLAARDVGEILRQEFPNSQRSSKYYPTLPQNRDVDKYYTFKASIERPGELMYETRWLSPRSDTR